MSWTNIDDEFTINDIGARLLANLARGIYNHEAVLREYVQNACDAYAALDASSTDSNPNEPILITIEDEDTLAIHDNGIGMNLTELKASKRIAVSPKAEIEGMTGFRGIGIWAGFQACNQLEIVTTKSGDKNRYRLLIDFSDILEHVNEDINIKLLLDGRFRIASDEAKKGEHYTRVTLLGLQGDYLKLTERTELQRIVSQILPCKIDPQFEYVDEINDFYGTLEGYQDYSILVDGGEVFKQFPKEVGPPQTVPLTRDSQEFGKAWYCTNEKGRSFPPPTARDFRYRSFRLRIRNFAVGRVGIYDDENASGYGINATVNLRSAPHLNWHVGEIHLTNPDLLPDTPRSALELDTLSRSAIVAIRSFYEDRIADSRALADFNSCRRDLTVAEGMVAGTSSDEIDAAALLTSLQEQDAKIRSKQPADKIKKRLRELLRKRDYKERLRKTLRLLSAQVPAATTGEEVESSSSVNSRNLAKTSSKTVAGSGVKFSNGADASVDFERLLSEVFHAIKSKLGEDDELFTEICEEILKVFRTEGLLPEDA
jgi:hypothetical protein